MMTFAFLIKISTLETARPYFTLSHTSLFISQQRVYRRECIGLWGGREDKLFFFFIILRNVIVLFNVVGELSSY